MKITKILVLNGPPRCGKDTTAQQLIDLGHCNYHMKFAAYLKLLTHRFYNLNVDTWYYEECKDIPSDDFWGATPRQAYIAISKTIKGLYGKEFWGENLASQIANLMSSNNTIVISDGGFKEELLPLIRKFGAKNIYIQRILRPDCDFSKDSRGYVDAFDNNLSEVKFFDYIRNDAEEKYLSSMVVANLNKTNFFD